MELRSKWEFGPVKTNFRGIRNKLSDYENHSSESANKGRKMKSFADKDSIALINPITERLAVILAGGDGTRLLDLTRRITGCERPKQFCPITSDETMLAATEKRIGLNIRPENTFFSLTAPHEPYFRELLSHVSKRQKIVQPENKGTGAAILYSLFRLERINPEATVAFFPADHFVSDDSLFMDHVDRAFREVTKKPGSLVLLGIEPTSPETSYGWIELDEEHGNEKSVDIAGVRKFWEKPKQGVASELMDLGCLWNSFVVVGKVKSFLRQFSQQVPYMYRLFCMVSVVIGTSAERISMKTIYSMIDRSDFSKAVLENVREDLCVLRVRGVSWSDLGEPRRVIQKLAELGLRNRFFPMAV
jgi:mannose-1-phosphate guanylyltransferase